MHFKLKWLLLDFFNFFIVFPLCLFPLLVLIFHLYWLFILTLFHFFLYFYFLIVLLYRLNGLINYHWLLKISSQVSVPSLYYCILRTSVVNLLSNESPLSPMLSNCSHQSFILLWGPFGILLHLIYKILSF